jgi:predicted transcriptional regulator
MVHADAEFRRGAEQIRDAARNMLQMGMSQQDAAIILGVSRQRVSQLLKV